MEVLYEHAHLRLDLIGNHLHTGVLALVPAQEGDLSGVPVLLADAMRPQGLAAGGAANNTVQQEDASKPFCAGARFCEMFLAHLLNAVEQFLVDDGFVNAGVQHGKMFDHAVVVTNGASFIVGTRQCSSYKD